MSARAIVCNSLQIVCTSLRWASRDRSLVVTCAAIVSMTFVSASIGQSTTRTITYKRAPIMSLIRPDDRHLIIVDRAGDGDGPLVVTPHIVLGGDELIRQATKLADLVMVSKVDSMTGQLSARGDTVESVVRMRSERVLKTRVGVVPGTVEFVRSGGVVQLQNVEVTFKPAFQRRYETGPTYLLFLHMKDGGLTPFSRVSHRPIRVIEVDGPSGDNERGGGTAGGCTCRTGGKPDTEAEGSARLKAATAPSSVGARGHVAPDRARQADRGDAYWRLAQEMRSCDSRHRLGRPRRREILSSWNCAAGYMSNLDGSCRSIP
jgi:hypothetical protein